MYEFSIYDLRRASCIGQRAIIVLRKGKKIRGSLEQICRNYLCIQDFETGLEINVPNNDIESLIFEGYSKELEMNSVGLSKFKRQCERIAEEVNISLGSLFSYDIENYANNSQNIDLKNYLLAETQNKAGKYTIDEYEEFYEYLLSDEKHAKEDRRTFNIINILMLFRMRKYGSAVAYAVGGLQEEGIMKMALIISSLMTQMKNHMGALFWLEHYYLSGGISNIDRDNVWWFYLKLISKYSAYESVIPLLKNMAARSPQIAVQSLAYLLLTNNSVSFAMQILDCMDEYLTVEEAVDLIDRNGGILLSDLDNNYHRFIRCMKNIVENRSISEYDDSEDITGYVFDYVPDREFGFILGFDLIVYFFRKESIYSDNVNKHIKDNICSMLSVSEEDLIMVTFRRTLESKRSYNAVDIV